MKNFFIIGDPISHSLSPQLHNYWFKKYNIKAKYSLLQIKENEIEKVINEIKSEKINGLNVTLPYKRKVIPFLDKLINDAEESNSVNTIYKNSKNQIVGENTDVFGFQAGYLKEVIDSPLNNQKALIIGAGGVSPSIILALGKSNIKKISLVNRTFEKSVFLKKQFKNIEIRKWEEIENIMCDHDIIINATSLGLKNGNEFSINVKNIKSSSIYIDTIYNPYETNMIKLLKNKGIRTFNGLDMFLYQGQKSFYLWNKVNPEIENDLIELIKKEIM